MSKKLIPELRFPEFENLGNWKNKPISKLGETVNGLSGKKGADFGNGKPYVQYKQVFDKSYIDFSECGKVDIKSDENQNKLQKGDILFTTSSETPNEVGFASVLVNQPEEDTYLNSFCFILRPFDIEEVNPSFARYLFHSPLYRNSVSAIAQGSTRFNLSKGAFLKLKVPLPQPQEQQKIAACLSSLDELLAAHNDKLAALKDHKKGLLQNLFPQEGERVPRVRFPEFERDGEWVEKKLGEICEVNPKVGELPNEFVYVDLESVSNGLLLKKNVIERKGAPSRAQRLLKDKDVIYQMVRPYQKNNYYFKEDEFDYVASTGYAQLRADGSSRFLFQLIHTDIFVSSVLENCTGSNYPAINTSSLKQIRIQIPPTIQEQQKIASCLSAVDELITAQQEKIDELQQHKKGLMQGLFPSSPSPSPSR